MALTKEKLNELLAKARAAQAVRMAQEEQTTATAGSPAISSHNDAGSGNDTGNGLGVAEIVAEEKTEMLAEAQAGAENLAGLSFGERAAVISLNSKQQEFLEEVVAGNDAVLIGRAGTGKTTCMRRTMEALIDSGRIPAMGVDTKWLQASLPGVAILSFTNKAVNNIRHVMPENIKPHCLTIHKLLEFAPVYYEVEDPVTGELKKTMRFEPQRNKYNPLPSSLKFIAMEESSMISAELEQLLRDAIQHEDCQFIYLGDIRQLPPVMGSAILGFKMLELKVVELTEVYRQALLSPILRLALAVDDGRAEDFTAEKVKDAISGRWQFPKLAAWNEDSSHGSVHIRPWQKSLDADNATNTAIKLVTTSIEAGAFNPDEDIILCPYNVEVSKTSGDTLFSCTNLNKGIMQFLGKQRNAVVHEIIAGYNKYYYAVGDRVLCQKEDAVIIDIVNNAEYMGKRPQHASTELNRWGHRDTALTEAEKEQQEAEDAAMDLTAIEAFMDGAVDTNEDRVLLASHTIVVQLRADDREVELRTAAEVNDLLGGYAITIHKAQGSEYDRVWLLFHGSHVKMISREMLYTAITRAKKHLLIVGEPDTIYKGIKSQRIKGDTLEEKANWFKGKLESKELERKLEQERIAHMKARIFKAAQQAVEKLTALYPNKPAIILNEIQYRDTGDAAGMADMTAGTLNFSPLYLEAALETIIETVVPHEVAHLAAFQWFKDSGHGTAWHQLCIEAGGTGDVYHTLEKAATLRTQQAVAAKAASSK